MATTVKLPKFRHAANLMQSKPSTEVGELVTRPDQAMNVREILHRYTTNQPLNIGNGVPVYAENHILYDSRRKNNIDLAEDRYANERHLDELRKKIGNDQKELARMARSSQNNGSKGIQMEPQKSNVDTPPTAGN